MKLAKELKLVPGDQVVLVDEGKGHGHWGFRKGRIYEITEDFSDEILESLDLIYKDNDYYKSETYDAFMKAKKLIQQGEEVYYEADW